MKIYSSPAAYAAARNYLVVATDSTTGQVEIVSQHATRAQAQRAADDDCFGNYYSTSRVMTRRQFATR